VPHLLYGHVDAAENYSVGRWTLDAAQVLKEVEAAGRLPIFVGGTGLYFKSLVQGLSEMPQVPADVRVKVRAEAEGRETPDLHARLAGRDPRMAAVLRPSDRQRVIRALEVFEATGRSLAEWQDMPRNPLLESGKVLPVFLTVERKALREKIDARFDKMLEEGALDEVRAIVARGLDASLPALKAHGAPALRRYLSGEISREEASSSGKTDTRHYAKRQETWFRHQMKDWPWLAPGAAREHLISKLS
jgi:tRNA dimethylallyltransferase